MLNHFVLNITKLHALCYVFPRTYGSIHVTDLWPSFHLIFEHHWAI